MSDAAAQAPGRTGRTGGTGAGSRIACCCLGGCCLVVVGLVALAAFGWFQLGAPVFQAFEDVARAEEESRAAAAELERLDEQAATSPPDDVAELVLDRAALDTYLAVRRELAPRLAAVEDARARMLSDVQPDGAPGAGDVFRAALGAGRGAAQLATARRDLLQEAVVVLEREGLSPAHAAALATAVEWRFLEEPGALSLGLPAWRRSELFALRLELALLEGWGGSGVAIQVNDRDAQAAIEDARERLTEIEAEARAATGLHPDTRQLLESRRDELESLAAANPPLAVLFEPVGTGLAVD